jgi:ZIP family zinc transporter
VGFLASLAAGLMTAAGALPVIFFREVSAKVLDGFLGFAAGVMLAATSFSLILPGIEAAGGGVYAALVMAAGILLGALFLDASNRYLPHRHFLKGREGAGVSLQRIWLFIFAITLHNFPEGLAVGVGFGSGDPEGILNGLTLAAGIGLQNLPEGLAVAAALVGLKYGLPAALGVAALTGLVEPVGGLLGVAFVNISAPLLPWGMAFAAGAMLFVISDEIIPETHRRGFERIATFGVMIGFVVMMFLDITLG